MKRIIFVLLISVVFAGCSCLSFPSSSDYKDRPSPCLEFARCMYYNQKNPDKTICADFGKACRKFDVYNYCVIQESSHPDDIKAFQSCWDKLE